MSGIVITIISLTFEENSAAVVDPERYISYPARVDWLCPEFIKDWGIQNEKQIISDFLYNSRFDFSLGRSNVFCSTDDIGVSAKMLGICLPYFVILKPY